MPADKRPIEKDEAGAAETAKRPCPGAMSGDGDVTPEDLDAMQEPHFPQNEFIDKDLAHAINAIEEAPHASLAEQEAQPFEAARKRKGESISEDQHFLWDNCAPALSLPAPSERPADALASILC